MLILNKRQNTVVNFNNILCIMLSGNCINAIPVTNTTAITLGMYSTDERATEVFDYIMQNHAEPILIMPEE